MDSKIDVIPVETDVLIIGGGLAGCMAAIKAAEHGVRVTIVDKANTENSGCAGTGIDHIWSYIPPVHSQMGWTIDDMVEDHVEGIAGGLVNRDVLYLVASQIYDRVMELEKFGVKIRYDDSTVPGKYRVVYQFHSVPAAFNFDGRDVKLKLTREAKKRGVQIVNRVMVTDLVSADGRIAGAVGLGVRDGKAYSFKAKAVVLSTGRATRLNRTVTGLWSDHRLPVDCTGDGKAMAFRAGLGVVNMEFLASYGWSIGNYEINLGSPRNTVQPAGSITGPDGEVYVPRTYFYDWSTLGQEKIDAAESRRKWVAMRRAALNYDVLRSQGKGPFFLDMTGGTDYELDYIKWSIGHEGKGYYFLQYLAEQEHFDFGKDKIEFLPNCRELGSTAAAGVVVDKNLQTQLQGLFAAGDDVGGLPWSAAAGAFAMGGQSGGMAGAYAGKQSASVPARDDQLDALREACSAMLGRKIGYHWRELELAVQNVVEVYNPDARSAAYLSQGLDRLRILKEETPLKAETPHELMRCLEVGSVIQNAEMVMRAGLERKETRRIPFRFIRTDYPEQDDANWLCLLSQSRVDGAVTFTKIPVK